MQCPGITCPLNFPHFFKQVMQPSLKPGRPSGGAKSEWFIRTIDDEKNSSVFF
jgi:hypothetical protein